MDLEKNKGTSEAILSLKITLEKKTKEYLYGFCRFRKKPSITSIGKYYLT